MKFFNKKVRQAIFARPYSFYFLFFFFLYLIFNIWINKIYVTYGVIFYNPLFGVPLVLLMILVTGFVALNINLIIIKFRDIKKISGKEGGITTLGIFLGIIGGACPGCIVGLFPVVLGIFGSAAAGLDILPLNGLELQAASLILLIIGAKLLSKPNVCKID